MLCIFSMAIGHFGWLMLYFGTFPCISCHFASIRDCFPPYFVAEIPLACLHIIFHVICIAYAPPRFACPCARISRHYIFIRRHLMWVWLRLTHVSISPYCILYVICIAYALPRFACPCARNSRQNIFCHRHPMWVRLRLSHVGISPLVNSMPYTLLSVLPRIACIRLCYPMQWCIYMKSLVIDIWAYTNMSEPQPHSHRTPSDKNLVPRTACTRARKPRQWHMQCNG